MIPDIDSQIGISLYTTKFSGIGGKIRITPEDFEVSELISKRATNSITDESGYAVYKLKKKKIILNTILKILIDQLELDYHIIFIKSLETENSMKT